MINARFAEQKCIQSRGVWRFSFEVPISEGLVALHYLGTPDPVRPTADYVLARLNSSTTPRPIDNSAVAKDNSGDDHLSDQSECVASQQEREAGKAIPCSPHHNHGDE